MGRQDAAEAQAAAQAAQASATAAETKADEAGAKADQAVDAAAAAQSAQTLLMQFLMVVLPLQWKDRHCCLKQAIRE